MLFGLIFIILLGLFMIITPKTIWLLAESWKSDDATEPSYLYVWSTRFGGFMFFIIGVSGVVVNYL